MKVFVCDTCPTRQFKSKASLHEHVMTSSVEHPNCNPCDRRFASKDALAAHFKGSTKHPNCGRCAMGFLDREQLKRHQASGECTPGKSPRAIQQPQPQPSIPITSRASPATTIQPTDDGDVILSRHLPFPSPGGDSSIWDTDPTRSPIMPLRPMSTSPPRDLDGLRSVAIQNKWKTLPNKTISSSQNPVRLTVDTVMRDRYPSISSNAPGIPHLPEVQPFPATPSSYATSVSDESSANSDLYNHSIGNLSTFSYGLIGGGGGGGGGDGGVTATFMGSPLIDQRPPSAMFSIEGKFGPLSSGPVAGGNQCHPIPEEDGFTSSSPESSDSPSSFKSHSDSVASVAPPTTAPTPATSTTTTTSNNPLRVSCRICQTDPCQGPTATICGHLFCYSCIAHKVLETQACPVCGDVLVLQCLYRLHLDD